MGRDGERRSEVAAWGNNGREFGLVPVGVGVETDLSASAGASAERCGVIKRFDEIVAVGQSLVRALV
jgi:hypothetical protein